MGKSRNKEVKEGVRGMKHARKGRESSRYTGTVLYMREKGRRTSRHTSRSEKRQGDQSNTYENKMPWTCRSSED
jgi:hypothetical protein